MTILSLKEKWLVINFNNLDFKYIKIRNNDVVEQYPSTKTQIVNKIIILIIICNLDGVGNNTIIVI